MAIDLSTPTISPPSQLEVSDQQNTTGSFDNVSGMTVQPGQTFDPAEQTGPTTQISQQGVATSGRQPGSLDSMLSNFAAASLQQPSRYDSDFMQGNIDLINAELNRSREQAVANLNESMAQRGLVGSSVEGDLMGRLESDLYRERMRRLLDLEERIATTTAQDRTAAFQQASQLTAQERDEFLRTRALQLQEYGLDTDAAYKQAQIEMQQQQFGLQQQQFDLSERQVDIDEQMRQRALELQEYGIDSETAQAMARIELERQMANADRQQQWELGQEQEATRRASLMANTYMDYVNAMNQQYATRAQTSSNFFEALARLAAATNEPGWLTGGGAQDVMDQFVGGINDPFQLGQYPTPQEWPSPWSWGYAYESPYSNYDPQQVGSLNLADLLSMLDLYRQQGP